MDEQKPDGEVFSIAVNKIRDKEDTMEAYQFYKHNKISDNFKLNVIVQDEPDAHDEKTVLDVKFQTGGTATNARNGVFIEDLLGVAYAKLSEFNEHMPSRENSIALTHIEEAILNLINRKAEREYREVYGTENA